MRFSASRDRTAPDPGTVAPANARLTARATIAATAARPTLRGAALATAARSGTLLRIDWWHADLAPARTLIGECGNFAEAASDEGKLQRAAWRLIDYLAGRWPPHASPDALGFLTDGTGVAVSPEHPDPTAAGWMARHARGEALLKPIVAISHHGPAALLVESPCSILLH